MNQNIFFVFDPNSDTVSDSPDHFHSYLPVSNRHVRMQQFYIMKNSNAKKDAHRGRWKRKVVPKIQQRKRGRTVEVKVLWENTTQGEWHFVPKNQLQLVDGEWAPGCRVAMKWKTETWYGTLVAKKTKTAGCVSGKSCFSLSVSVSPCAPRIFLQFWLLVKKKTFE